MSRPARDTAATVGTGPLDDSSALVVSSHQLASQAAIATMTAGGNAVDAAVAANAVLGVVLPDTCGPGGDLFALIHTAGDQVPAALNASGRAGAGASAQRLRDAGHTVVPLRSRDSITIPGCLDGWEALVGRFGALSLADDLATAVGLASDGFRVSEELAASLARLEPAIGGQPSAAPLFPEQRPPLLGDIMTRPLLAETLRAVASGGRGAFYQGPVGRAITDVTDGVITAEDLLRNQSQWIEPLGTETMGLAAWTIPPNSQGWLTLATLRIFELLDPPRDPLDPAYHHALIEAYRSVAWERDDITSDPDTASLDTSSLLDETRLADRAEHIDGSDTTVADDDSSLRRNHLSRYSRPHGHGGVADTVEFPWHRDRRVGRRNRGMAPRPWRGVQPPSRPPQRTDCWAEAAAHALPHAVDARWGCGPCPWHARR